MDMSPPAPHPSESMMSLADMSLAYMGDPEALGKKLYENLVGHRIPFNGPFGEKQVGKNM